MRPGPGGSGLAYLPLSLLVVALDQATKWLVMWLIDYGTAGIEILPCFNLVHVYNEGAAFSLLASVGGWQRWLFVGIAVVISLGFVALLWRTPRTQRLFCISAALFVGGALGNLIDRLALGHVVDFLLFYLRTDSGVWSYPAFNVADIAVCVGAGLLVLSSFLGNGKRAGGAS
ncbi:MAG: signal peptidase II [Succinivibrionaceae bacterium]|nr:signal peptidase II [Succinivibrionaceae bacterium]